MPISKISAARGGIPGFPEPYWSAPGAALYLGDVRACLRRLPTRSVHCAVTSPPYWGLRDYGTGTWEGGSAECDHVERTAEMAHRTSTLGPTAAQRALGDYSREHSADNAAFKATARQYAKQCKKCGANRIDQQIGAEDRPDCLGWATGNSCGECFVCHMVEVFAEVRRVLRDDGVLWLNLGDKYDGGQYLIPSRVALALEADGWRLVQDIIWYAPNKMPESVTNRCSKSHEHIFLLAKGPGYYYDAVAIAETAANTKPFVGKDRLQDDEGTPPNMESNRTMPNGTLPSYGATMPGGMKNKRDVWTVPDDAPLTDWLSTNAPDLLEKYHQQAGNKQDTWTVPTQGYPGAHFATFSPRLITPCILAGTSEHGCCAACGRPYERVVARTGGETWPPVGYSGGETPPGQGKHSGARNKDRDRSFPSQRNGLPGSGSTLDGEVAKRETLGWRKVCGCQTDEVAPCVVLDPFSGSGTTVATSLQLGRHGVGIDLSENYIRENAIPRIEAALRGEKVSRKPTVAVPPDAPPPPSVLR